MTGTGDWFSTYVDEGNQSKVVLGDDSTQSIQGYGDIPIKLKNGDTCMLKDDLARNLLSVGCITDQHMSVEFFKDHFIIKDLKKHGEEVAHVICSNDKLYKLITMGGQQVLMTQKAELSHLWHRRYGHLHIEALKYLHDKGLVTGLPRIEGIPGVWEPCFLGKYARTPFPKVS